MSKMQEHIFDDVHGGTVCRNCRGDSGISKCQQFGISPLARLRLRRRPEACCDDVHGRVSSQSELIGHTQSHRTRQNITAVW